MPVPLIVSSSCEPSDPDTPSVLSYFAQRRAAGYIGILLPPVVLVYDKLLALGCVPCSISASYHTGIRNFFVGSLCAVGVFLISSIGYEKDKPWSIFAGGLALAAAFFPANLDPACRSAGVSDPPYLIPWIHGVAATLLFLTFAYFCLVLFIRTKKNGVVDPKPALKTLPKPKKHRNVVFLVCGWIMLITMAVFALWSGAAMLLNFRTPRHLLFTVEWICLWAFGFAWLVKGQQLFKDAEGPCPGTSVRSFGEMDRSSRLQK